MFKDNNRTIKWTELQKHSTNTDCWILIDGIVYNVTTYLAEHPGGDDILLKYGGKDATQRFKSIGHTDYAISIRDQRKVGMIEQGEQPTEYQEWIKKQEVLQNDITWDELEKHNKQDSLWMVIDEYVYDLTKYQNQHPGGSKILITNSGKDASQQFQEAKHPESVKELRKEFIVGKIKGVNPKHIKNQGHIHYFYIIGIIVIIGGYYLYN
ncbi:succinate, putative [Ichthyophthirius multifiliis]|uniref:Succinate, putative n=1 Tax=Ichthyophthirius multifiliis TaxID=5932 RepID=G0QKC2_ICHMU|nr:succinate, putative [Ichthyophthirius multifiliis]EGR34326.1 succinate, putative [Ichthyophthirius multifiliis]|eukprot:XP_004039630.1 succinate, putative [Ichthyophthirius multifiliis]